MKRELRLLGELIATAFIFGGGALTMAVISCIAG